MGLAVDGNETKMPVQELPVGWETSCWGCGLRVVLPKFAPMFKCGWCGAITIEKSEMKPISPWSRRCSKGRDRVFVCLVLCLTFSIVFGGVWATFPVLFPTATVGFYVHSVITIVLSFNTLFNYCMAAFRLAGPSPRTEYGKFDLVDKKTLEGYKFCVYCKIPKPPNAHHCRSCQCCVVDMDHHCPFIGNCVGANNHQHFLLFLLFASVSGLYVLTMSTYVGTIVWPQLLRFRRVNLPRVHAGVSFDVVLDVLAAMVVSLEPVASTRAFALIYLFIASLSLVIGVGLLLYQQVQLVYTGQTYLGTLTSGSGNHHLVKSWTNFRRLFGKQHPFFWLLPRVGLNYVPPSEKIHTT
ncbi:hypothetical protein M758_5G031300 [Ceratodon purpureus]|uniref:S-acyltransferase n=1 Tax=Ceratodon purpureus TaxID=3225 RepID=A0A8T0HYB4_CERPU|nr:hypothetical protein KC19_5G029600 [Ceratodon purpureus]KAG0615309.1 hypothetical protein M758_5G031300 [Ceratodon purpureus]